MAKLPEGRSTLTDEQMIGLTHRLVDTCIDCKARIEELIAERDEAWRRAGHAEEMWGRAEVKLLESEAKMAIYKDALKHIAKHDTQMWAIKALSDAKGDDDE